ncbi:MAG: hypothetical protein WBD40_19995 [Tepidisphaeraceae bacterium]
MALPPKGDPQRPLCLATQSTQTLGVLLVGVGALSMLPRLFRGLPPTFAPRTAVMHLLIFFGPGALYLLCSIFIRRRRVWAVRTAMVLAGFHLLLLCIASAAILMAILSMGSGSIAVVWVPLGALLIFAYALVRLEYHLARSFEAIGATSMDVRGFEVSVSALPMSLNSAGKRNAGLPERPIPVHQHVDRQQQVRMKKPGQL